ncbi:MAG: DNRLRE domain-containing protein, partial [Lentisphaeraceae bacterium]|nr:DNRLRE domain-containing protein [Lentisphaeraceae bacterium]
VSYQSDKASYVEVLEGEVEVSGKKMDSSKRYTTGQKVLVQNESLESVSEDEPYIERSSAQKSTKKSVALYSSSVQGKEYEVIRVNRKQVHYNPEIIMVKNSKCDWARKGYIRFDLSSVSKKNLEKVSLNINMVETGVGFACFVDNATFDVYGLNESDRDKWESSDMKWENAPGTVYNAGSMNKEKTTLLGSFSLPKGVYKKAITLDSAKVKEFILQDQNKLVTFIVVRRTAEKERHGLAHGFASSQNTKALPPRLVFEYE